MTRSFRLVSSKWAPTGAWLILRNKDVWYNKTSTWSKESCGDKWVKLFFPWKHSVLLKENNYSRGKGIAQPGITNAASSPRSSHVSIRAHFEDTTQDGPVTKYASRTSFHCRGKTYEHNSWSVAAKLSLSGQFLEWTGTFFCAQKSATIHHPLAEMENDMIKLSSAILYL